MGLVLFTTSFSEEFIAVIELTGTISQNESAVLTDKLINLLSSDKKFRVVERSQMKAVLDEQEFQQTGCTNSECAVDIGQILGVAKIVTGSIGQIGSLYSISLRMINVSTGEIEQSSSYEQTGTIEDVLTKGLHKSLNQLLGKELEDTEKTTIAKDTKPKKELSPYEAKQRKKRVGTILTASGATLSAGACLFFAVDMNKKKESYDALGHGADFDAAWDEVEQRKTLALITGCVSVGFTISSVLIGTKKIKTPKGNELSFAPSSNSIDHSLTLHFNF